MDEIDLITDAAIAQNEAMLAERRRRAEAEARAVVPASRECGDCGCDIPPERLKARPTTTLCVDCQNDAEAGRGRR